MVLSNKMFDYFVFSTDLETNHCQEEVKHLTEVKLRRAMIYFGQRFQAQQARDFSQLSVKFKSHYRITSIINLMAT